MGWNGKNFFERKYPRMLRNIVHLGILKSVNLFPILPWPLLPAGKEGKFTDYFAIIIEVTRIYWKRWQLKFRFLDQAQAIYGFSKPIVSLMLLSGGIKL